MNDTTPSSSLKSPFGRFASSGRLTPLLVGLLCIGLLIAAWERGHGNLHRLQNAMDTQPPAPAPITGPGGQEPIHLKRSATTVGAQPEFLSVTLLPGRGMDMLQLTASIPGRGEVPLLVAPAQTDVSTQLTGTGDDINGARSTSFGGAFLAPWAATLSGTTAAGAAPTLETSWKGQRLAVPAGNNGLSVEGLLLKHPSDSVKTSVIPDGQSTQAVFHVNATAQGWPTTFDVTILVELTAQSVDLTMTAVNTGHAPMPIGLGWHPYFAIPSGDRANATLSLPSMTMLDYTHGVHTEPTGHTYTADGTPLDFARASGVRLGATAIDATYTTLQSAIFGDGPIVELRDPEFNLGLRMILLSPNINSLRVIAPPNKNWVSIGPNTNYDDPLGSEWRQPEDAGLSTLQPGATYQWKVRLEIAPA